MGPSCNRGLLGPMVLAGRYHRCERKLLELDSNTQHMFWNTSGTMIAHPYIITQHLQCQEGPNWVALAEKWVWVDSDHFGIDWRLRGWEKLEPNVSWLASLSSWLGFAQQPGTLIGLSFGPTWFESTCLFGVFGPWPWVWPSNALLMEYTPIAASKIE